MAFGDVDNANPYYQQTFQEQQAGLRTERLAREAAEAAAAKAKEDEKAANIAAREKKEAEAEAAQTAAARKAHAINQASFDAQKAGGVGSPTVTTRDGKVYSGGSILFNGYTDEAPKTTTNGGLDSSGNFKFYNDTDFKAPQASASAKDTSSGLKTNITWQGEYDRAIANGYSSLEATTFANSRQDVIDAQAYQTGYNVRDDDNYTWQSEYDRAKANGYTDAQAKVWADSQTYPEVDSTITSTSSGDDSLSSKYREVSESLLNSKYASADPYVSPDIGRADDGSSFITGQATVQQQLADILAEGSAYTDRAKMLANEQSSELGLLSSSMAVGAATGAAIDRALPIAEADAATYGQAQLAQQGAQNTAYTTSVEGKVSAGLQEQKYDLLTESETIKTGLQALYSGADAEVQYEMQERLKEWDLKIQTTMQELESDLTNSLESSKLDWQTAENVRTSASGMITNNQIAIESLLKDPDFIELPADVQSNRINDLINSTTQGVRFLYKSSGIPIVADVEESLISLETMIRWSDDVVAEPYTTVDGEILIDSAGRTYEDIVEQGLENGLPEADVAAWALAKIEEDNPGKTLVIT